MYRWKLEFVLKSGKEITVYCECDTQNSGEIANEILRHKDNSFSGFNNEDKTKNIFVKTGEIASISISKA
jgi:hypothetical protein